MDLIPTVYPEPVTRMAQFLPLWDGGSHIAIVDQATVVFALLGLVLAGGAILQVLVGVFWGVFDAARDYRHGPDWGPHNFPAFAAPFWIARQVNEWTYICLTAPLFRRQRRQSGL